MRTIKNFNGKESEDLISVLIPLYRSFDLRRIKLSIDSLKQQKKINLEIVVAEQSHTPSLQEGNNLRHIFIPNNKIGNPEYSIPGLIRNTAAKSSSGRYLYNSDGDIVYTNPFYFAEILELIKTGNKVALYRPPMRRLPLENFEVLISLWQNLGLHGALDTLDTSDEFTAKTPGSTVSILSFKKKESGRLKTFLYSSTDFKAYTENPELKGNEPKYSTLNVHAGGTFMERKHFFEVGGFCQEFKAWGCHDADLQWKLRSRFNLIEFPKSPEYEVLHLDHEREYFDKEKWQANRKLQELRREKGVNWAIGEDQKNGA